MKDEIFNRPGAGDMPFAFNAQVAQVFDDMVSRSVPHYSAVLQMTAELTREFYQPETVIYDLGCSTGALVPHLQREMADHRFKYLGLDSSDAMVHKARQMYSAASSDANEVSFALGDIADADFPHASVVIANYTFQFLRPLARRHVLEKINAALSIGGALLISEKCLEDSADISRLYADRYHALKARNGYSQLEIAEKRNALENVLVPFRVNENVEMLQAVGFTPVSIFFKCYNFASFLAVKA